MELNLSLSVSEKVDLEFFLSHLCRRFVESERCVIDTDYKRIDGFFMSDDEFKLVNKLLNSFTYRYD